MKYYFVLVIIIVIGGLLRFMNLGLLPPSLYWEEVALGYDAFSIAKTGKDYHNNPWPIVAFESFGDYKPSGYFYFLVPFIRVFGLSEWVIRFPSALAGTSTILFLYLFTHRLTNSRLISLGSAASLAVMPWHLYISRVGFEANLALMWLVLGMYFSLGIMKKRPVELILSSISFALSMYTYHGQRVIAPLVFGLLLLYQQPLRTLICNKLVWVSGFVLILLLTPIITNITNPIVMHRFQEVSYFSINPTAVVQANELREQFNNAWWSRIIFHRYWFGLWEVVQNIASHYSPHFLFVGGDGNPRHQNVERGLLYYSMLPLILASIFYRRKSVVILSVIFIFISLIPASISFPTPHSLRAMPAVIGYSLLLGLGFSIVVRKSIIILGLILMGGIIFESFIYIADYKMVVNDHSDAWQYGYKQAILYVNQNKSSDDEIYMTRHYGRPSMYVLFYTQFDPHIIQAQAHSLPLDQGEYLAIPQWDFELMPDKSYNWRVDYQPYDDLKYSLSTIITNPENEPVFYIYKKSS
jgi:4-amino-4-deoxy-L-arabinose transferase-like glycosyltransferase